MGAEIRLLDKELDTFVNTFQAKKLLFPVEVFGIFCSDISLDLLRRNVIPSVFSSFCFFADCLKVRIDWRENLEFCS